MLLVDEDLCATNFMVRDDRMRLLVKVTAHMQENCFCSDKTTEQEEHEPILPFLHHVRPLFEGSGVSTVLIVGGIGDYLDVADTVVMMQDYHCLDVTEKAKEIAMRNPCSVGKVEVPSIKVTSRIPDPWSIVRGTGLQACSFYFACFVLSKLILKKDGAKVRCSSKDKIAFDDEIIDLSAVEQIIEIGQTRAIAEFLVSFFAKSNGKTSIEEVLQQFYSRALDEWCKCKRDRVCVPLVKHLTEPFPSFPSCGDPRLSRRVLDTDTDKTGELARPRRFEIAFALNRLRTLSVKQKE